MNHSSTAYKESAQLLRNQLHEAALDHEAFESGLAVCELDQCRATCCHDGVILSKEEAQILSEMDDRDGIFEIEPGRFKTRTVEVEASQLPDDFPSHFPKTRCVYLDAKHRCHWQLKALEERKHPWFYKPFSCWMHPVLITRSEGRPRLTILPRAQDSSRFASYTPCGQTRSCAAPARLALRSELEMLGELAQRDFLGELNAPSF